MATTTHDELNLIFQFRQNEGSGGQYGHIYMERPSTDIGYHDMIDGSQIERFNYDNYMGGDKLIVQGTSGAGILSGKEQADVFKAMLGTNKESVLANRHFWVHRNYPGGFGNNTFNPTIYTTDNPTTVYDDLVDRNVNDLITVVIEWDRKHAKGSLSNHATFCDGGIWYYWDTVADELRVRIAEDGVQTYNIKDFLIASSVATQADVKAAFEAIYPDGQWEYAWNTTTNEICVRFVSLDENGGTFTYSVSLEEEINISDDVSAFIVRPEQYNREWSNPR